MEPSGSAARVSGHAERTPSAPDAPTLVLYRLGDVVGVGQTIRHEFELRNPTDEELRIVHAQPLTPCCSSIGDGPNVVPPRGSIRVPVTFKPGYVDQTKQVEFVLRTDSQAAPIYRFVLAANVISSFGVERIEGQPASKASATVSGPSRPSPDETDEEPARLYRVTCRKVGSEGLEPPERVETDDGISAVFLDDATVERDGDMIEFTRTLRVAMEQAEDPGFYKRWVRLHWDDGSTREFPVAWTIAPHVEAKPAALVFNSAAQLESEREIEIVSRSDPFRVVEVDGPLQAEPTGVPSDEPAHAQRLRVAFDPEAFELGPVTTLRLLTDHPRQHVVEISLFVKGTLNESE